MLWDMLCNDFKFTIWTADPKSIPKSLILLGDQLMASISPNSATLVQCCCSIHWVLFKKWSFWHQRLNDPVAPPVIPLAICCCPSVQLHLPYPCADCRSCVPQHQPSPRGYKRMQNVLLWNTQPVIALEHATPAWITRSTLYNLWLQWNNKAQCIKSVKRALLSNWTHKKDEKEDCQQLDDCPSYEPTDPF